MKIESLKLTTLVLFAGAFLVAAPLASAQEIQIESKFDAVELTKETYGTEIKKCIPAIDADSSFIRDIIKDFPVNGFRKIRNSEMPSVFVAHQRTAFCLKLTPGKHPIYATEAFIGTVSPGGPPEKVVEGWYRQIATLIAQKGSARIAYAFANGNAFIANYSVEADSPEKLLYSAEFRKAGDWESEKLDTRFTHASLSTVTVSKWNDKEVKPFLLLHRN
jgi:hypothetical protein